MESNDKMIRLEHLKEHDRFKNEHGFDERIVDEILEVADIPDNSGNKLLLVLSAQNIEDKYRLTLSMRINDYKIPKVFNFCWNNCNCGIALFKKTLDYY